MEIANLPVKFQIPFANSAGGAYINNPVPVPDQTGSSPGAASFTTGFPPDTFISEEAGGFGPSGKDFNGLLFMISAWQMWQAAGFVPSFDSVWSALSTVGGYPKGARLNSSVTQGLTWLNTVDNNQNNPDVTPTGWLALDLGITLTGDVSGTPGATVIGNAKVTSAKIANNAVGLSQLLQVGSGSLLTNPTGGTANLQIQTFANFLTSLGFTTSFSAGNSSVSLFGFIIKFGINLSASGGAGAVGFTTPFPSACLAAFVQPINVTVPATANLNSGTITTTGFGYENFISGSAAGPLNNYWAALGN